MEVLRNPILYGAIASIGVIFLGFWLGGEDVCIPNEDLIQCTSKWNYFKSASPNEIGDTLAGFAGALAFVWIIVTVAMQSLELRAQREELALTRSEFEKMSEAQQAQVKLLVRQGEIFSDEQRQRDEVRSDKLLDEKLRSLLLAVSETGKNGLVWSFSNEPFLDEDYHDGRVVSLTLSESDYENLTIDEAILKFRRKLSSMHDSIWDLLHQAPHSSLPNRSNVISELIQQVEIIDELSESVSVPQRERLGRMRFREVIANLKSLEEVTNFWEAGNA
ncbi:MAG: hypothetical protein AAFQ64_03845 [Pseudomonadota bacterium]